MLICLKLLFRTVYSVVHSIANKTAARQGASGAHPSFLLYWHAFGGLLKVPTGRVLVVSTAEAAATKSYNTQSYIESLDGLLNLKIIHNACMWPFIKKRIYCNSNPLMQSFQQMISNLNHKYEVGEVLLVLKMK